MLPFTLTGTFFFLKADFKSIQLHEERNVRVELTVKPAADRQRAGVEGTKYKSTAMYGQIIEPNHTTTAAPLKHADGIIVIALIGVEEVRTLLDLIRCPRRCAKSAHVCAMDISTGE